MTTTAPPTGPSCYDVYQDAECVLLQEYPYYFHFSCMAPYTESTEIDIAAIELLPLANTFRLLLNPKVYPRFDLSGATMVLAHEILHVVYEHPLSPFIDHELWGIAIDMAVNSILLAQGFKLPVCPDTRKPIGITIENTVEDVEQMWAKLGVVKSLKHPKPEQSAEYYLDWLLDNIPPQARGGGSSNKPQPDGSGGQQQAPGGAGDDPSDQPEDGDGQGSGDEPGDGEGSGSGKPKDQQPGDQQGSGSGSGKSGSNKAADILDNLKQRAHHDFKELTPDERELAKVMVAEAAKNAAQQASPPGNIAGRVQGLVDSLKVQEPWQPHLKKFSGMLGSVDINTSMFRRNKYGQTPRVVLKPRKRIVIFIDSSGSVHDGWVARFLGVVEEISKFCDVYLMWIDCQVHECLPFSRANKKPGGYEVKGRGGTSMREGFRWLNTNKLQCDGVIVCTDLELYDGFPTREERAGRKVLWVGIKGNHESHPVPPEAGEVIYIPAAEYEAA